MDAFGPVFISGRVAGAGARLNRLTTTAEAIKEEGEYEGSLSVEYRILKSADDIGSWKKVDLYGNGSFFVNLSVTAFDEGVAIVELFSAKT